MISSKRDARLLLGSVQVIIIDEIHAFAGDDRGWHMLCVLERISRLCGREVQRIGLSATVGNPDELLHWLTGSCCSDRRLTLPLRRQRRSRIGEFIPQAVNLDHLRVCSFDDGFGVALAFRVYMLVARQGAAKGASLLLKMHKQ